MKNFCIKYEDSKLCNEDFFNHLVEWSKKNIADVMPSAFGYRFSVTSNQTN